MKVTTLGHAGLLIETRAGTVLCDPWFVPAFMGSWFPFPRNDQLPAELMAKIENPDYLYISHRHGDHFDLPFLREHVSRDTTVLLPDFPATDMDHELQGLGFTRMLRTETGETRDLDGLEVMILTETAITDGPQGDSVLVLSDGTARVVDQNDCRPHSFDEIRTLGAVDAQFLQFSGAIWYPMVYEFPPEMKTQLAANKRQAQLARAVQYVRMLGAGSVVPSAGPPCFLDPDLFDFNDFGDPTSIFPDQTVFLELLRAQGISGGVMNIPGTVLDLSNGDCTVTQPLDSERPFTDKKAYLRQYQADWTEWLGVERSRWVDPQPNLVERLAAWFEPLLAHCPRLREGVGANVVIRTGDTDVVIDFPAGEVRPWAGEPREMEFVIDRPLVETVLAERAVDWSNALFLSLRFKAWRAGDYNEFIYNFFKSLSPERIARAEAEAAIVLGGEQDTESVNVGGWEIERFCPHRRADLTEFGSVCDGVLTCHLHGWQFDLETGRCLTSAAGRPLQVRGRTAPSEPQPESDQWQVGSSGGTNP